MKMLPLKSLAFSIPPQLDASLLEKYCEMIGFWGKEMTPRDTMYTSLHHLYLDGGCITPFTLSADSHPSIVLEWREALRSQRKSLETLVMKRVLHSEAMFCKHFSRGFVSNLKTIDVQILYSKKEEEVIMAPTMMMMDAKESQQNKVHQRQQQPVRSLFESLSLCRRLETLRLDLVQYVESNSNVHGGGCCSVMMPFVDIWWMD